jgi:catechol 2,3-dioxygenase
MKVQSLGHVVLKVSSLERAEAFYSGILGLPIAARAEEPFQMTFFTLGNHHDFAVMAVGDEAGAPAPDSTGLFHVAFKIGNSLDELLEAKQQLAEAGIKPDFEMDHTVTKSLYFHDPDGNAVEVYVDASDAWRSDPHLVADAVPVEF